MATEIPHKQLINIFEATRDSSGPTELEIGPAIGMNQVAEVAYVKLPSGSKAERTVPASKNVAYYVVTGSGKLQKGTRSGDIGEADCFVFVAKDEPTTFTLVAADEGMSVLILSLEKSKDETAVATTDFPTIVSGEKIAVWGRKKGISARKYSLFSEETDFGKIENRRWGMNLQRLPPGTQSSNAHAHLLENEFVVVLSGNARYWHSGESPEKILVPGDAIGWTAGTGICHSLLNDAEDEEGSGTDVVLFVWGDDFPNGDKVHYATTSPEWWTDEMRWFDRPEVPVGPASALPKNPRPEDKPHPPGEPVYQPKETD